MKKIAILTGLLCMALICFLILRPVSPVRVPDDIPGKFISVDSQTIRYIEAGSGVPLVFIHGFGASIYSWRKNLEPIAKYHHVFAPDLPGFGYSDKPLDADYSVHAYADFMIRFMDRLKIEKAILVGHSLGGGIALLTSLRYPARVLALILLDAEAYPITPPLMLRVAKLPGVRSVVHQVIGEWVVRASLNRSFYNPDFVTQSLVREYYRPFLTKNGKAAPIKVLQDMDFEQLQELPRRYRSIKKKALIIWGREDQISGLHLARKLKKDLPNSSLRIIPECGHLVQEEKPEVVNRTILGFVRYFR